MNIIESANQALFLDINGNGDSSAITIALAQICADWLIYLVPLVLVALWLSGERDKRAIGLRCLAVIMLALGFNQIIGLIWVHPRPFAIELGHAFAPHAADSSFPSDHLTVFTGAILCLWFGGMKRLSAVLLLAALVVAWARIFLGVHFPMDMVGAAMVVGLVYAVSAPLWNAIGGILTDLAIKIYRAIMVWPIRRGWLLP